MSWQLYRKNIKISSLHYLNFILLSVYISRVSMYVVCFALFVPDQERFGIECWEQIYLCQDWNPNSFSASPSYSNPGHNNWRPQTHKPKAHASLSALLGWTHSGHANPSNESLQWCNTKSLCRTNPGTVFCASSFAWMDVPSSLWIIVQCSPSVNTESLDSSTGAHLEVQSGSHTIYI